MTESEKIYRLLASIDRRLSRLERQAEADNARKVYTAAVEVQVERVEQLL